MSQAWKWGIAIGFLIAFSGLLIIPSALAEQNTDPTLLAAGLAVFALGVLIVSISFYLQARSLSSKGVLANTDSRSAASGGKRKLVCDVCRKGAAVIQCTMHRTILCPACLTEHYDSRGCVYVPTIRRVAKTARSAIASRS